MIFTDGYLILGMPSKTLRTGTGHHAALKNQDLLSEVVIFKSCIMCFLMGIMQ